MKDKWKSYEARVAYYSEWYPEYFNTLSRVFIFESFTMWQVRDSEVSETSLSARSCSKHFKGR